MRRIAVMTAVAAACAACLIHRDPTPPRSMFRIAAGELDVRRGDVELRDGYQHVTISYASPVVGRVPADLYLPPDSARARVPAVVFLHGLPGQKETMAPLAIAYAKAGIAGLTISAPFNRDDIPYRRGDARLIPAPLFNPHDRDEMI